MIQLAIIAPDFGDDASATTSRYGALLDAAEELGIEVVVVRGGDVLTGRDAKRSSKVWGANTKSLARRTLQEIRSAVASLANLPRDGLVLVPMPPAIHGLAVSLALATLRRPYVVDTRDIYPDVLRSAGVLSEDSALYRLLQWMGARMLRNATQILAATRDIEHRVRLRTAASTPVRFVPNGFGLRFAWTPAPSLDQPLIVCHGTMGRFQNIALLADTIVAARTKRPHWKFRVIGDGPSAGELERAVGANLDWRRRASPDAMPGLLAGAACGLSLRSEDDISAGSLPVRIYEYIGLGVPIVASPPSEGTQLIESNRCGISVPKAEPDAVIASIDAVVSASAHQEFRASLAAVRDSYSATAIWKRTLTEMLTLGSLREPK